MAPVGLGLLLVGTFAILMMHLTGHFPRRFPWKLGGWRKEDDPKGWRRYLIMYSAMAGTGALVLILHFGAEIMLIS